MALGRRALGVELESERFNQTVKEINELVGNNLVATSGGLFISITQHPHLRGGVMKSMDKLTTGVAYGTSAGSAGYWFLQWLDQVSPSQWAAIGVLGSLVLGFLTYLTNLYFKIREDKRKAARGE